MQRDDRFAGRPFTDVGASCVGDLKNEIAPRPFAVAEVFKLR
jgi:hypothetical protein